MLSSVVRQQDMNMRIKGKSRNNLRTTSKARHNFCMTSKTRYTYNIEHVTIKHSLVYESEHINKLGISSKT
jgi:hypothetical protein